MHGGYDCVNDRTVFRIGFPLVLKGWRTMGRIASSLALAAQGGLFLNCLLSASLLYGCLPARFPESWDIDGDGYGGGGDCDDADPLVNPGAREACDGIDNDCNGLVDDSWPCDPGNCGDGTWGVLPLAADTVFVDVQANDGGNGSEQAPFQSIQTGLDAAAGAGGGMVAVAGGVYSENLVLTEEHAQVQLAGRCADRVFLDGAAGGEDDATVLVEGSFSSGDGVQIAGLTVLGGQWGGVVVAAGHVVLEYAVIEQNVGAGVVVSYPGSHLSLTQVVIQDNNTGDNGSAGIGLIAQFEAYVEATDCLVARNAMYGIYATGPGTHVALTDVEIRDTSSDPSLGYGRGIEVRSGAYLHACRTTVADNADIGISAQLANTSVRLEDVEVLDTQPGSHGESGKGIVVAGGAFLDATSCLVERSTEAGIFVEGANTEAAIGDVTVSGTSRDLAGAAARGIHVREGATIEVQTIFVDATEGPGIMVDASASLVCGDCELQDSKIAGAVVVGSSAEFTSCSIAGTAVDDTDGGGFGVYFAEGADVTLMDSDVSGQDHAAVFLDGAGAYILSGNRLIGGKVAGYGDVLVATNVADAQLEDNEITAAPRIGILLDRSTATLSGNTYQGNGLDLVWQDCGGVDEPVGHEEAGTVEWCPETDYPLPPISVE